MAAYIPISKPVSAGDPVTAELFNNFITDLQKIATPAVTSNVVIDNALETGTKATVTDTIWNSGVVSVSVKGAGTPKTKEFKFTKKFTKVPQVWVQVYTEGLSLVPFSKSQIFTQIQSVTTTKVDIYFRCATDSNIKVVVFATGEIVAD
jgi:hypothetical protein